MNNKPSIWETSKWKKKMQRYCLQCDLVAHLVLQLLHISCNKDQLFSGQEARTPALTAAFIHRSPAGSGRSWAGQRPRRLFGHLRTWRPGQHLHNAGQGEGWAKEAPANSLHVTIPHRGTWRIAHRAAGWASRGGEPEAARRLYLTSISLDRTTAPQTPAGGTRCQWLQQDRHWRRSLDAPLSPCTWNSRTERAEKSEPKQINVLSDFFSCTSWRAHADDVKQGQGTLMGFP